MDNTNRLNRSIISRQRFFEKAVHLEKVKDCISGKNEIKVISVLQNLGYVLNTDFVRQYPIAQRYVLDFAFVNEQVALEIDGDSHNSKIQTKKDNIRDRYLRENNWISIRIKDEEMFNTYKFSFYKNLIRDIVDERRQEYNDGDLRKRDFTNYNVKDYE